jgi:prepilin-type processing-associated H-X9-DG protein
MDQAPLYNQYNFNLNSQSGTSCFGNADNNNLCGKITIQPFRCPSEPIPPNPGNNQPGNNYAVCSGANSQWSGASQADQNGVFNFQLVTTMASITDGTSNTIMVGEISTAGNPASKANCVMPTSNPAGNNVFSGFTQVQVNAWGQAGLNSFLTGSNINLNKEGKAWHIGEYGITIFNTLLTPNSMYPDVNNNCGGCDNNGTGMHGSRSYHSGGTQVLMGDGAVRFVSASINFATWSNLGSRADGNPLGDF